MHNIVKSFASRAELLEAEIERLRERCEAYKGQVKAGAAEIERLRAALDAAKAFFALRENWDLSGSDAVVKAIDSALYPDQQSTCPEHPTGRMVDEDGKRICTTCGR